MTNINKEVIKSKLEAYIARYESQNKAAASLKGVSAGTLSQVMNNKWDLIAEEMWRKIASQIGYSVKEWHVVESARVFKMFNQVLSDAQVFSNVFAVIADAGSGKTTTVKYYSENNPHAFALQCNEYWNRKSFLQELLRVMGHDSGGLTVCEMMADVVNTLKKSNDPLIIMDEADKLSDQLFFFFITLYNQLEDHCGIVMDGTDYFKKRILKGVSLNKRGYKEFYSRIGRNFIELKNNTKKDLTDICLKNGLTDELQITEVVNESEDDVRRVKRKIHAFKQREA